MRRGGGISSLSRHTTTTSSFAALSSTLSTSQLSSLQSSLSGFREALTAFAIAHKKDIRTDPAFRHQFQKMCAAIGVDPLSGPAVPSSLAGNAARKLGGGLWTEMLGLGETVYEISVQVVDICISTRGANGGMIELNELTARVDKMRGGGGGGGGGGVGIVDSGSGLARAAAGPGPGAGAGKNLPTIGGVSSYDVLNAIDLLKPLHAGYTVVKVGEKTYVRSVPRELDMDQSTILTLAATTNGRLTRSGVKAQTGWNDVRTSRVLEDCVMREGMGWVDDQAGSGESEVWLIAAVSFGE